MRWALPTLPALSLTQRLAVTVRNADGILFRSESMHADGSEAALPPAHWQTVQDSLPSPEPGGGTLNVLAALDPIHPTHFMGRFQLILWAYVALATLTAFMAWLNFVLPNCHVRIRHAVIGGFFAAGGIALLQWGFGQYLQKFSSFTVIYGAFSILPVFLLWLYLCWLMVLLGCVLTAELSESPGRQYPVGRFLS